MTAEISAAALLVHAYARSNTDSSSIDWDDLNAAHEQARKELGAERCKQIEDCYEADSAEEDDPDRCTNPGGHQWNRSAGEADEAHLAGDAENDNIRCIHCGADGDA